MVHLPPTYPINHVKLETVTQGKIVNVNLYSNRAEVSRLYEVKVASGQNHVAVHGLPNVMDQSSFRVEGRGKATIQDVTISREAIAPPPTTSEKLRELEEQQDELQQTLERCTKTLEGLDRYLKSLDIKHLSGGAGSGKVLPLVDEYNEAAEKYDRKATELKGALKNVEHDISTENLALLASTEGNTKCLIKAAIGVFAEEEGNVELILKYAVTSASWSALYDVRVTTETKENPVEIIYKAAIHQNTGEDWADIPITLETAAPTYGLSLPTLTTWSLSVYTPPPPIQSPTRSFASNMRFAGVSRKRESSANDDESDNDMGFGLFDDGPSGPPPPPRPLPAMAVSAAAVTSAGGVNATFRVPGLISIPSDGVSHNVTIVKLQPEASLLWLAVPRVDARVHLTTSIKNTSEYTLLPGASSVYVDGSFISKSTIPLVSPQESFTCALGLDPSIRVTYHPLVKKSTQSGILTKVSSTSFSQRISVYNSKASTVAHLKITDHIPVSQDSQITIKLLSPGLTLPGNGTTGSLKDLTTKASVPVKVVEGVLAQWVDDNADLKGSKDHLGKDGKVQWVCSLESQKKIDLLLQWEVSVPSQTVVLGL